MIFRDLHGNVKKWVPMSGVGNQSFRVHTKHVSPFYVNESNSAEFW